ERVKKAVEANLSPEIPPTPTASRSGSSAQRTYGQSWLAIPRKTRLYLSCTLFGTALVGLWVANKLEENIPA
ncbi:hypothetical protein DFH11DRAFT_1496874, partial [Phellopilus nigrolimitatus]